MAAYRIERDGIVIAVRLTPRSGRDAVEGIGRLSDGHEVMLARVRAVPEKGAANDALVALLAKALDRPKTSLSVIGGATARIKQVRVLGDPQTLISALEKLARRAPKGR